MSRAVVPTADLRERSLLAGAISPLVDAAGEPKIARRWFGTGRSSDSDARAAGAAAAAEALNGRTAALIVVFCPAEIDMAAMLEGVGAEVGDVPLIGCSGQAQLASGGPAGLAVVVNALGGEGFEVRTSVATGVSTGQRDAGERVAENVQNLTRDNKLLLMLCDGLAGEQHELVRGAFSVVGAAVPLAGGCAADNYQYKTTYQFFSDSDGVHVLTDAVVAAAIGSDAPIGIGVAHGWHKVGDGMVVTKSEGGHVRTLDGEPALDTFLRRVDAPAGITADPHAFKLFALRRPLGMSRRSGEDIRVIHGGNVEDASITCLADVPQGALLWTMETEREGLLSSVDDAFAEALEPLGELPPLGFLAFDCGVRFLFLGEDGVQDEVERFVDQSAGVPFGGMYTYGEIARTRGARGMHHLTLVLVAFA